MLHSECNYKHMFLGYSETLLSKAECIQGSCYVQSSCRLPDNPGEGHQTMSCMGGRRGGIPKQCFISSRTSQQACQHMLNRTQKAFAS